MGLPQAFLDCMLELDVPRARELWRHVAPHMVQPADNETMLIQLHMARTQSEQVPHRLRFYSYRWLTERGLPEQLPDHMRPAAERMYPRVVEAVGVSCNASSEILKPVVKDVQRAMQDAVEDCYAERRTDPLFVRGQMAEARRKRLKAFGLGINRRRS